ncbi:MAG TPA: DEAD/DEAH box helicase, partial [Myxococcaceae bacterium]|nr:DEAD/DEAH box helicase [Myxococcaceae bacterium]
RVLPVYGGTDVVRQLRRLEKGVDVVVATPGRALDLLQRGSLSLGRVELVVLDEADEMLDMGFAEELEALLSELPEGHQTALFSATLPARISAIVGRHLRSPVQVRIDREKVEPGSLPRVRQQAFLVSREHREAALVRVLRVEQPASAILFCRTRTDVDSLCATLLGRGFRAEALHGGLSQEQRDRVMRRFKAGTVELLVATDVAARGLHIDGLSHVINYDVPGSPEAYVHRIGRTGRAGREGVALTFAGTREHRLLQAIERVTKQPIELARVPGGAELRALRLERTRERVQEALAGEGQADFRQMAEALCAGAEPSAVLAAALQLVHAAHAGNAAEDEAGDIPSFTAPAKAPAKTPLRKTRSAPPGWASLEAPRPRGPRLPRPSLGAMTTLVVSAGSRAGLRPADLVGAIANEARIPSKSIGAIQVTESFSRVEVPEKSAAHVAAVLRGTTLRGRKVSVRLER